MKQFDILSFGEPLFEFNQLPTEHSEQHYLSGFGGDTSNFAISAARQGAKVAMLTRLGDDIFGQKFRALWDEEKVDHQWVCTHKMAPTGIYFISHNEQGHHFTFYRKGSAASTMTVDDIMSPRLPPRAYFAVRPSHTPLAITSVMRFFTLLNCAKSTKR